jgi:hypothetical protein
MGPADAIEEAVCGWAAEISRAGGRRHFSGLASGKGRPAP